MKYCLLYYEKNVLRIYSPIKLWLKMTENEKFRIEYVNEL